ncbi:hypothetical protein EV138_2140 [Kribbella voronezhensis]|uniref:Uncharacterized protein n=1 Tax=Kribbella voronezhensis TaxID=2512212 RepID=A0A4R7T9F6_9ACTN|nr:hypothetical protein [Kribbella voronezhensis]TDU88594.1 hypothetical protein EV138_2140 [Kribbella voronezhensis]
MTSSFDDVQQIADALLFEGYVLYPYRASDGKNRVRWQFGVLMPPAYGLVDPSERTWSQTDCLLDGGEAVLTVRIRFLQAQRRTVLDALGNEVDSLRTDEASYVSWDEAVERQVDVSVDLQELPCEKAFEVPGGVVEETVGELGTLRRTRQPLTGVLALSKEELPGPYGVNRLRLRLENRSPGEDTDRVDALRQALIAHHLLVAADGARFISLLEPPEWATGYAAGCENLGIFPVLAGDVVLSSPIILYDHPRIAPESQGEMFDATEIDEILSLRTMTLTEEEKREVRGTDPRAAAMLDRVDAMPQEILDRLHGTVRYLRAVTAAPEPPPADAPWWDPGNDASVSPETDTVMVGEVAVGNGVRVRLRPGVRRADAQDMFLADRLGTVVAVLSDVDGETHVAVALDGEEGEVQRSHGRYLYFSPDELEPLVVAR